MKKTWIIGLLVLVVLISGCTYGTETTSQPAPAQSPAVTPAITTATTVSGATAAVEIKGFAFTPATLTIQKGTTVTWTNKDSAPHTVTGDAFGSETLSQGQAFGYTFNEAVTFEYQCHIHPNMKGKVIVT